MSIREQVKELREYAGFFKDDKVDGNLSPIFERAAYTIEVLSAKLKAANIERSVMDYGMSDDLISRSEAEKKIRAYADEVGCERGEYELANGILKAACLIGSRENMPTAYDVDKVVEQLEDAKYEEKLYPCNLAVEIEEAKRIVKSGGVE